MSQQVRKICLLGDFCVGKTSTVRRFVDERYDDKYLTTVGVKIDTKLIALDAQRTVKFIIWDIAGTDKASPPFQAYLKGAAGYVLVADGTRADTVDKALSLQQELAAYVASVPWVGLLNKADLVDDWDLSAQREAQLAPSWRRSSAKTGENVEQAFTDLATALCP